MAIAFAHNFVEIWNIQNNTCVYSIQCEERCILFSARFFGDIRSELILASGTVFNQVHFWDIVKKNASGDGLVFKKLIGHEVSSKFTFNVQIDMSFIFMLYLRFKGCYIWSKI